MSFKVVRDVQGRCIAFGPNDANYAPGESYEIEEVAPALWISQADAIRAQIEALERQYLMPRATREFMLLFMEAQAAPEVLAVNPGYQAVKAFDEQIKTLRSQL